MLVLSRKVGEAIVVDGRVHVEVARISGGRVRLLVDAPPQISVDRLEVWRDRVEKQKQGNWQAIGEPDGLGEH